MTPAHRFAAGIFDLGGVLIDWDPRYLYRKLFPDDEDAMERFLAEVTTRDWNRQMDAGRAWHEAIAELKQLHPEKADLIQAYWDRWPEMLGEVDADVARIIRDVRAAGLRVYAISNWSAETFPVARDQYPFLAWFEGIVISGEVGVAKPDARIFEALIERHGVEPSRTVFVDDSEANVVAAEELGFIGVRFADPGTLRADLERLGLLDRRAGGSGPT